jgi:hypothetical protein
MIFQHTWKKVLSGEKTQTRRIVKPGERLEEFFYDCPHKHVYNAKDRLVYQTWPGVTYGDNPTYAVQPGRGQKQVARIRIRDIRREDVREISDEDVKAEGFETASDFFITWCKIHDKGQMLPIIPDYYTGSIVWQGVRSDLQQRPAERYQAWALTIEVVR